MFHPIELFVGLRYTRAKRRNHFISFIALTSVMGIVLGVTALITVMSVMNGFEKEVRERILGMAAHAIISSSGESLQDWQALEKTAVKYPGVTGAAPFVEGQAMVNFGGQVSGAQIRGIDPAMEPKVSEVGTKMVSGNLDALQPGSFEVVLGRELANSLGVGVGDKLTVITPQATVTLAGILPRIKRFTVSGIFEVGMYEYDRSVALINMRDAALLFNLGDGITGVRLKLADMDQAPLLARTLQAELPSGTLVTDWTRLHANYFSAVQQEKRVMFIILTLIIAVAMFNIVSALVMVVTDKQADIAILRTLGATPASIMGMFFVQGAVIGTLGTLLGMLGGVSLALNVETIVPFIENLFDMHFLDPGVYYISTFPSDMHWQDVWKVCGMAFVLSLLATIYPSWRASRVQPAEALRYE